MQTRQPRTPKSAPSPVKPSSAVRRKIVVNRDNIYDIMFTTDIDLIETIIDMSPYKDIIDANTILKINQKAAELSMHDFRKDPEILGPIEFDMLLRFQNIVARDPTMTKILRKKRTTEWDELELINWSLSNHAFYCDRTKPPSETPTIEDEEYIL